MPVYPFSAVSSLLPDKVDILYEMIPEIDCQQAFVFRAEYRLCNFSTNIF